MAANAGAIRAGRAFVSLSLDDTALGRGLAATSAKLKAWGAGLMGLGSKLFGLGSLVTGGMLGAAKVFDSMGSALKDAADRTGFAVEELSALKFAAEQSGASFEDLENSIKFMQKGGFGTTAQDFMRIADEIKSIADPAERTRRAIEIFGRGGTAMLPAITSGFRQLAEAAQRAGFVMSAADAEAADALGDAFGELAAAVKFTVAAVGAALAPALMDLVKAVLPIISSVAIWIRQNQELVVAVMKVAAVVAAVGAGLMVLGVVLPLIGASVASLSIIAKTALAAVAVAFKAWMSPVNWLLSGIRYLSVALLMMTETGAQVRAGMVAIWEDIKTVAIASWTGIVNAIKAGDLALAGKIALAALKVVFTEGMTDLQSGWLDVMTALAKSWSGALGMMALAWNEFTINLRRAQSSLSGDLAKGFIVIGHALGVVSKETGREMVEDIDRQTRVEQQALNQQSDAQRQRLAEGFFKEQAALDQRKQDRLAGLKAELDAARAELNNLNAQAANKAQAAGLQGKGIQNVMAKAMGQTGTGVGTFSAAGALAMGGGGGVGAKLEKQLKEQEQIRKGIEKLVEHARAGAPLAFA